MRRRDLRAACGARPICAVRALIEGETDVQVLSFRVRGLFTRHWNIDQRTGRRPRLAQVSHVGDGFAGRDILRLRRRTHAYPDGEARVSLDHLVREREQRGRHV